MKLLLTIIAAVVVVGCGTTPAPEPPTAKSPSRSIHRAAMNGNIEAVKQHLDAGTDVNAKDVSKWTPLHYAAFYGHKVVAELLIAEGADVNAKTKSGFTPLDATSVFNKTEIADLLRKHGGKTKKELEAAGK